jgi:hypothetical protein
LLFDPEYGSNTFFRNVHTFLQDYTALYSRRQYTLEIKSDIGIRDVPGLILVPCTRLS